MSAGEWISAIFAGLALLIAFIGWLTKMYFMVSEIKAAVVEVRGDVKGQKESLGTAWKKLDKHDDVLGDHSQQLARLQANH